MTKLNTKAWNQGKKSDMLHKINAYWRAENHISVGQICLYDHPLLKLALVASHVKPKLLGHWGTTPGQNFNYVHLNRAIVQYELDMIFISGPGHGELGYSLSHAFTAAFDNLQLLRGYVRNQGIDTTEIVDWKWK